jgi:hypothetical protein
MSGRISPQGKYGNNVGKRGAVFLIVDNADLYFLVGTDGTPHLLDSVTNPAWRRHMRRVLQKSTVSTHDLGGRVASQLVEARGGVDDGGIR